MNKLFADIGQFQLNEHGRSVVRQLDMLFDTLFEKYDSGELSYLIMEEASLQAGISRYHRQQEQRQREQARVEPAPRLADFAERLCMAPAVAAPPVNEPPAWHNMQIPMEWFNPVQVAPQPPVADDAEDVEF